MLSGLQMVLAVAAGVVAWFETNIFTVLKQSGSPQKRIKAVMEHLRAFYAGHSVLCAFGAREAMMGLTRFKFAC